MDLNMQTWREELKEGTMCKEPQRQKPQMSGVLNTHALPSSLNLFSSGKCTGQSVDIKTMFAHSFFYALRQQEQVSINCILKAEMIKVKQKEKKTKQGGKFFTSECL